MTQAPGNIIQGLVMLGNLLDERLNAALEPEGLSVPKLGVLHHLVQAGEPIPLGVLSERLGCVKSNVTQLVDRLEADALVRRVPDPEDRRSIRAAITDEGRRRYAAGQGALEATERELLADFSASDRESVVQLLSHAARTATPA